MVTFYFHRTNTLFGKLVRFVSRGYYNHVSIGVTDYIYQANPLSGVTKTKANSNYYNNGVMSWHHHFDLNEEEVIYFLEEQIGKKYDYIGALSFIWIFLKPRMGFWFCSELAMVTLMKGLDKKEYNQKQSPQDFYYVTKLIK